MDARKLKTQARRMRRMTLVSAFALTAVVVLAGCHDMMNDGLMTYDEARGASGSVLEPEENTTVRLGVIHPENPENVSTGRLDVVVLLFDEEADSPVEGAGITIDGFMPMHGHGTSPEEDPSHDGNGVYSGYTTLSMGGMWNVFLNVTLPGGSGDLSFTLGVHAMADDDEGMDHDMHDDMDDDGMDHDNMSFARPRLPVARP